MSEKSKRDQLIEQINDQGREMSSATIFFHHAVAEKVGLSGTDHKYLDLLHREGSMTAGELANRTGLTTGAVTGVVNRLEKAGLATRKRSDEDRRKVMIELNREAAMQQIAPIFSSMVEELQSVYEEFDEKELKTILAYLENATVFFEKHARSLKNEPTPS